MTEPITNEVELLRAALADFVEYVSPGDDAPLAAMLADARALLEKVTP